MLGSTEAINSITRQKGSHVLLQLSSPLGFGLEKAKCTMITRIWGLKASGMPQNLL